MKANYILMSTCAVLYASGAAAQAVGTPDLPAGRPIPANEPGAAPSQGAEQIDAQEPVAGTDTLDDIVVTAQRRSERLVDVPVSVSVVTSEALAAVGTNSLTTVTKLIPGVYINNSGYTLAPTVRGIGSTALGAGIDTNVAVYVDGVYQADQTGNIFDLANISGLEILKGPQGTLFGRNATGGAILVKTFDPDFTRAATINLSYGNFQDVRASAYLNQPLTETLAVNGAIAYRHSDGWIRDIRSDRIVNEARSFDVRGKLLWKPSDEVQFILAGSHSSVSDPTTSDFQNINGNSQGRTVAGGTPIAVDRYRLSSNNIPVVQSQSSQYSLHGALDFGFATLASITAYHSDNSTVQRDTDGSYAALSGTLFQQYSRVFTQEVNLTSPSNQPLTYVIGAFYYHQDAGYPFFNINGNRVFSSKQLTDALAGYADGNLRLGDLTLIAGLRYSTEERKLHTGPGAVFTYNPSRRYSDLSPRVGVRYAIADSSNIYATYNKGFKSGQFDPASFVNPGVSPEKVNAYEVGFKTASHGFSFSASSYYYDYKNIQVTAYNFATGITLLLNAARAEIYGADAEATAQIGDNLKIRGAVAYTHARYTEFPGAPSFNPRAPGNIGNVQTLIDASGNTMIRAPELTVSGSVDYTVPLAGERDILFSLTPFWSSKVYFSFNNRLVQPAYFNLDASVRYKVSSSLSISAFARNLTDRAYATFQQENNFRDIIQYAQPRTYGASLLYSY